MRHWLEHSFLIASLKSLDGESPHKVDDDNLLQLATHIVFAENLCFGDYELPRFVEGAQALVDRVIELGLPMPVFERRDLRNSDIWEKSCNAAAEVLAITIGSSDFLIREADSDLIPPAVIATDLPQYARIEAALRSEGGNLDGLENSTSEERMLRNQPGLFSALNSRARRHGVTTPHLHEISVYARYYLNQEMASSCNAVYSPSVARARLLGKWKTSVLAEAGEQFRALAAEGRHFKTEINGIGDVLMVAGKGEPKGILEQAIAYREKAEPIRRAWCGISGGSAEPNWTSIEWGDAMKTVRDDFHVVRQRLGLAEPPSIRAVFSYDGFPFANAFAAWDLLMYHLARGRLSVLTEFAYTARDRRIDGEWRSRLRANASKNLSKQD